MRYEVDPDPTLIAWTEQNMGIGSSRLSRSPPVTAIYRSYGRSVSSSRAGPVRQGTGTECVGLSMGVLWPRRWRPLAR